MDWGMKNRLSQLIKPNGRCMFMPIDHEYFQGPTSKLEKPGETIKPIIDYADALFCTRGVLRSCINPGKTQPPKSPFIKGDLKGLTFLFFWSDNYISFD